MSDVLALWERVTAPALEEASLALAQMSGLDWQIASKTVQPMSGAELMQWTQHVERTLGYSIGLTAHGLLTAAIVLVFDDAATEALVSALMGETVTVPLDAMGLSALAEVGNVVGTAFLNVFANQFQAIWEPSPPTVTRDSVATLVRPAARAPQVLVTDGLFRVSGTSVEGHLVIVPQGVS